MIGVKNEIPHECLTLTHVYEDTVTVKIETSNQNILLACIYNPPSPSKYKWTESKWANFFHELKSIQENVNCHTIIVTGDINFNTTDWQSMTANTDYELVCLDILLDHDYTEMLNKGGTQLDVLLCNNPDTVSSTGRDRWLTARYKTNETLCSDHRAYWTNLECTTPSANKPPKIVYAFKKADFKKLNDSIIKNPFTPFCYSNVDHLVHFWYKWIRNLIDKNIPRITKHRATLPPWISNATSHLLKQLQTLNRRKNLYSVSHQLKVRQMERKISAAAEKDLEAFEAEVFESRRFSEIQRYLSTIRNKSPIPNTVTYKSQTATSDQDKAELFNNFFASVFGSEHQIESMDTYGRGSLNNLRLTELSIKSTLSGLVTSKANGPDNIGYIVLKKCSESISKSLLQLYQTSLNKGVYPSQWKVSQITPIHKSDNKSEVTCYRPISLLCACSKVYERLIYDQLYLHIKDQLHPSQYGFRKNRSVTDQMISFLDKLYNLNDDQKTKELAVFYTDFSKAFDTVPHALLAKKLHTIGFGGNLMKLLVSYLHNRYQRVRIGNKLSTAKKVTSGVPQGSILGPLFFIIFVNDLPETIDNSASYGFADDFKIISTDQQQLTESAERLQTWCQTNSMILNIKKCSVVKVKGDLKVMLNNTEVTEVICQRDLGIMVSNNLSWTTNCQVRTCKALNALHNIKRNVSKSCRTKTKLNAYVGYVMPILTYCSQTWAPNTTHCKSIERVQKTAMRWIAPTESTYKKRLLLTHLLPVTLYLELHDLLYLLRRTDCSTTENQENDNCKTTRQHARGERIIPKYRLQKTNDNFPYRAKKLLNAVIKSLSNTTPDEILKPTKSTLSNFFWSYFKEKYDEFIPCTWRILCSCGYCNTNEKLRLTDATEG